MADERVGEGDGAGVVLLIGGFSTGSDFRDGGTAFGFGVGLGAGFGAALRTGFEAGFAPWAFAGDFAGCFDGDFAAGFAAFDGRAATFGFDGAAAFAVFRTGGFFDAFGCFVLRFVAMLHLKPRGKS